MANRVFTGSRAVLKINGKAVGLFTSIQGRVAIDVAEVPILGQYGPVDLTTVAYSAVQGSLSGFRVPVAGSPMGGKGSVSDAPAERTGQVLFKLCHSIKELTENSQFPTDGTFGAADPATTIERTLEVFDAVEGNRVIPMLKLQGLVFTGFDFNVSARALSTMTLPFKALVYSDEVVAANLMQEANNGIPILGFTA